MKWLANNKTRVLRWGGLGLGCLLAALGAFVGARWVASGSEYEPGLDHLVPADVSYVLRVPSVPKARQSAESFLDELLLDSSLAVLESSPMWRDGPGKGLGDLRELREDTLRKGLESAARQADSAGVRLFDDVLGGELILAAEAGKHGGFVAVSRVSRAARFRWQFMDVASAFFPDEPGRPRLEYESGTLKVTPRRKTAPADDAADTAAPRTLLVTLLDDVLVISDSPWLFNATLKAHGGEKGLAAQRDWQRAARLPAPADAARHQMTLWLNLDQMRRRLPPAETGQSPVDTYTSLGPGLVGVMPDILMPLNTLLERNLDTTVFSAALYGLDLSDAPNLRFDQYLLADPARAEDPRFAHLRKTWAQPAREATQLRLLPPDTMLQVSYRQPLDVMYHEVLTERDRQSLVGDFFVAMQSPALRSALAGPVEEVLFATAPRSYAPGVTAPVPPVELPLPAFCIGFRVPGAGAEIPRLLLEEYLQAQRGRGQEPGEQPRTGAAVVVELAIEGRRAWGLHDPRDDPGNQILIRLNRSIRSALVGDWLLLTNSESLVARAIRNSTGSDRGLAADARNPFAQLDSVSSATIYVNLDVTADYLAGTAELFKLLRDTRYNPLLPEGLAPSDLRREIARSFGLDPASPAALDDPRVDAEYQRRKEVWAQTCQIEGDQYVARLQANFRAMRFFRDLALTTSFAADHLHVRGLLRVG